MSQENVEIVRAATEAAKKPEMFERLVRGDFDFAPFLDSEVEWDATGLRDLVPDLADVYFGLEGVGAYWRRWYDAWRDIEFDVQDYLDAGDEVVVLIGEQHQHGRYTGIVTELPPYALVYTFSHGKVVRHRVFPDQDDALKAVGLAE